jgi:hypothetical protein
MTKSNTTRSNTPASPDDDDCHFGPSNPLGPIDRVAATTNGTTSRTTSTAPIARRDSLEDLEAADYGSELDSGSQTESQGGSGGDADDDYSTRSTRLRHTTVWTTVLPSGQAYRTTRALLLVHAPRQYSPSTKEEQGGTTTKSTGPHRRATATPLSTLYESSTPLGPTHRVILDYHQPYDGSYTQTKEYIRSNGGSTIVKQQEFNRAGVSEGQEEVMEYPPMMVGRGSPRSGSGSNNNKKSSSSSSSTDGGNNIIAANGGGGNGTTTISELTNTLSGTTVADGTTASAAIVRDDPTMDPTTIDYNAGYDPQIAERKQEECLGRSPADIFARLYDRSTDDGIATPVSDNGNAKIFRPNQEQEGRLENGITIGPTCSWSMTENYSQGEPATTDGPVSFVTVSTSSSSRRRRAKYCKYSYFFTLMAVLLSVATILGAVISTKNKRNAGGSSQAGTDSVGKGDDNAEGDLDGGAWDWTFIPADPKDTISDTFAKAGFTKSWSSEEGWLISPSFASFSSITGDISEADNESYYEANYVSDEASCAEKCIASNAMGGAYFDLSAKNKRNVCLCFKAAECYDPTLEFSGGHVFMKEEHYVPMSQTCQMSLCGYFPDDPLCSSLGIVTVEALVDIELSPLVGLVDDADTRTFEETCASFLNDQFTLSDDSPVEGVRCKILDQGVSGRRRGRQLQDNDDSLELGLQITGLFVPTSRYKAAESVNFSGNALSYFDQNGDVFLLNLRNEAEASGSDYFQDLQTVKAVGPVVDAPGPTSPLTLAREPSPEPSHRPTRRPTTMPVPSPTMKASSPTQSPPTTSSSSSSELRFCKDSKCWVQIGELKSDEFKDHFGDFTSLTSTGSRFVISASKSSDSGFKEAGFCKVYDVNNNGDFQQKGQTLYGFQDGDEVKCKLSQNGDRLIMVAKDRDNKTGRVWILELGSGKEWVEIGKIAGNEEGEKFGSCVALSSNGTIVAIGAPFADNNRGRIRIYEESASGSWQKTDEIQGETKGGMFGWSCALSLDGNTLAVGHKSDDAGENDGQSGQVRVFRYNQNNKSYELLGDPLLGGAPGDSFGRAVALSASGDVLGVGSRFADGPDGNDTGSVRAFLYDGREWKPNPDNGKAVMGESKNDEIMNVALDSTGSRIVAGGGSADADTGYVKVFDLKNGQTLVQVGGTLTGRQRGAKFGANFDISLDGSRLIVGSPGRDHDDVRGSVHLFVLVDE